MHSLSVIEVLLFCYARHLINRQIFELDRKISSHFVAEFEFTVHFVSA